MRTGKREKGRGKAKRKSVRTIKSRYLLDAFWTCYSVHRKFRNISELAMHICIWRYVAVSLHRHTLTEICIYVIYFLQTWKEWQNEGREETETHTNTQKPTKFALFDYWPVWLLLFSSLFNAFTCSLSHSIWLSRVVVLSSFFLYFSFLGSYLTNLSVLAVRNFVA